MNMKKLVQGIMYVIGIAIMLILVGFIASFTWNITMPHLFGLPKLNIGTGLALVILSKLLFGFKIRIKED